MTEVKDEHIEQRDLESPKSSQKNLVSLLLLSLLLLIISIAINIYLFNANSSAKSNKDIMEQTSAQSKVEEAQEPQEIGTKHLIKLPNYLNMDESDVISVRTLDEIRNVYQEARDSGGCPGACGTLIKGSTLEEQFNLLRKIASLEECVLSQEIKSELSKFILFDGGIGSKDVSDLIYSESLGICGLKFIGADGYDAWLGNYEYEVGFMKDDKLVEIKFPLFPHGAFGEVDSLWESFGYKDGSCGAVCYEKQIDYMENISFSDAVIVEVIKIYDNIVSTFDFY